MIIALILCICVAIGSLVFAAHIWHTKKSLDISIMHENEALSQENEKLRQSNKSFLQENEELIKNKKILICEVNELTEQKQNS